MTNIIEAKFGTTRGAVRLGLAYAEVATGLAPIIRPNALTVSRLVFLCHGNICRSPFAEALAKARGMETSSFGLSTTTGNPAHPPIVASAKERGIDLSAHRATALEDFSPQAGDLLVAKEVRHLRRLAELESLRDLPRVLLGTFAHPPVPHLHDPYKLNPAYLETCLDRISGAVTRLCEAYPDARP